MHERIVFWDTNWLSDVVAIALIPTMVEAVLVDAVVRLLTVLPTTE